MFSKIMWHKVMVVMVKFIELKISDAFALLLKVIINFVVSLVYPSSIPTPSFLHMSSWHAQKKVNV
jgi:hypothetical protein